MPGVFSAASVVTTLVCFLFYTRGCGRNERPASPRPFFRGQGIPASLGHIVPRECGSVFSFPRERGEVFENQIRESPYSCSSSLRMTKRLAVLTFSPGRSHGNSKQGLAA